MSVIKIAFLVLSAVSLVAGYVVNHPTSTNPEFPGHCWVEDLKQAVKSGEEWTNREKCEKISCSDDFSYEIVGCGLLSPPPSCTITPIDNTKNYPDCCPKFSCN
uniref:Single domain-containing protein n=1 Tax=Phlebotomus papatasi TaxID=29031 RepID=A0A1B0GMK7_PHLPP